MAFVGLYLWPCLFPGLFPAQRPRSTRVVRILGPAEFGVSHGPVGLAVVKLKVAVAVISVCVGRFD